MEQLLSLTVRSSCGLVYHKTRVTTSFFCNITIKQQSGTNAMKHKLLALITILLIPALLAGCVATPPTAPATAPSEEATAAPTAVAAEEAATTITDTVAAANCEAGFRHFDHELLATDPICIPTAPQRIIALDVASVELTLMTDKTLLATSGWLLNEMPILLPQFAETLAGIEDVGYPANLETILLLDPDLILAVGGTNVGETIDVEQALAIAPVVIADPAIYADWKLGTGFWSEVLNVTEFYGALEENYFTRVAELQSALGNPGEIEVSVMAASTYGISLWMPDTPPGAILRDVGLARPEAQSLIGEESLARYEASQYIPISEERLDLVDGDAIFYFTYAAADPETAQKESDFLQSFAAKPLWQALDAVKADHAFIVGGHWWRSQSYLLANQVIDDLFAHLTDTKATTPVLESAQP
jgi:iron complex transport system substrate-binding protein